MPESVEAPADEDGEALSGLSDEAKAFWARLRHDHYCWPNAQF